jgi:hypothetical protein
MGFKDDKSELFETINVFKVTSGLPKIKKLNSLSSIDSTSKNLLPFLLDLLQTVTSDVKNRASEKIGDSTSGIKNRLGDKRGDRGKGTRDKSRNNTPKILKELIQEFLPILKRIVKEGLIKGIKAGLVCGTDFTIPNPTPELTTEIDRIDLTSMLKIDINGPGGSLFGNPSVDFNKFLLDIITNQNSGTWTDRGGVDLLEVTFNQPTVSTNNQPTITLKVTTNRAGTSFHSFLIDYVNSMEIFNTKNLMATIMEYGFGVISSVNNFGVDVLLNQAKTDAMVDKILETDFETTSIDNSFYEFNNEELNYLENQSRNKMKGVSVLDLGCGLVEVAMPSNILDELGELDTATPKRVNEIIELTLSSVGDSISQYGNPEDGPTMKGSFDTQSVISFPKILMRAIITPKVVSLYQISSLMVNSNILTVKNSYDFSRAANVFFTYVTRECLAAIIEIIFNKIKRELITLISNVVRKIVKEKLMLYVNSIAGIYITKINKVVDKVNSVTETIKVPNPSNNI